MEQEPKRGFFRRHRVLRAILIVIGVIFAYRLIAVYRIRTVCRDRGGVEVMAGPRKGTPEPENPNIVFMTYNIEGHAALIREDHLERLADAILAQKPDVVGLQEVHSGSWQARFRNQAAALGRLTGMTVVYGPSFSVFGGEYGNAILTTGTVESAKVTDLPGFGEPRSMLDATLRVRGRRVRFVVTHLASWGKANQSTRLRQTHCVAERLRSSQVPFVAVGDLNAVPDSDEIRDFVRLSGGLLTETEFPATNRLTNQRLDYVAASPQWKVVSSAPKDTGPSDHIPIVAELTLTR